jgi:predicted ATPase
MAAALQTIQEIGDPDALAEAVADAFPGSSISVLNIDGRFEIAMHQHGLLRPLRAAELSDGTLRYLLWIAALLTPRPPGLLVLNEPETSLHPDLLPALGISRHSCPQVDRVSRRARRLQLRTARKRVRRNEDRGRRCLGYSDVALGLEVSL